MEVHSKRAGFVTSAVKGGRFLINGKPVRIRGTNRHDNNCDNGRALTTKQIKEDLLLMIEYAHAMGNGPGNLEHIWDFAMEHPEFMGGYVWEFRSHGKRSVNAGGGMIIRMVVTLMMIITGLILR